MAMSPIPIVSSSHHDTVHIKQALRNSCKLLRQRKELHTSSLNCMQAHGTSCKLRELYANSWNFMHVYVTQCKLM